MRLIVIQQREKSCDSEFETNLEQFRTSYPLFFTLPNHLQPNDSPKTTPSGHGNTRVQDADASRAPGMSSFYFTVLWRDHWCKCRTYPLISLAALRAGGMRWLTTRLSFLHVHFLHFPVYRFTRKSLWKSNTLVSGSIMICSLERTTYRKRPMIEAAIIIPWLMPK